jgi:DNA-binding MarR family transcriptional regulator
MARTTRQAKPQWLHERELAAWRGLQRMQAQLTAKLNRELSSDSGLSLQDYTVLVVLSEQPSERLRSYELGRELGWEKSRLSHHIARMTERHLVARESCPGDQRGLYVILTPQGRETLEAAAPGHVAAVRRAFVDLLSPAQLDVLASIAATVVQELGRDDAAGPES